MRGGGLTRFTPEQGGGGWMRNITVEGARGFAGGFKGNLSSPRAAFTQGVGGAKTAVRRAVKRKAQEEIKKRAKRAYKDLFSKLR